MSKSEICTFLVFSLARDRPGLPFFKESWQRSWMRDQTVTGCEFFQCKAKRRYHTALPPPPQCANWGTSSERRGGFGCVIPLSFVHYLNLLISSILLSQYSFSIRFVQYLTFGHRMVYGNDYTERKKWIENYDNSQCRCYNDVWQIEKRIANRDGMC